MCPCFLHSLPHMQHRVQCELARRPKNCATTLKGFTACKLLSFIPWRLENCNSSSVLEKSKLCEHVFPRRRRSGEMLVVESLDGGPNFFGQFLEEALVGDCQVPHERNFMHHVGSCLALLNLQSTGNTNVSIPSPHCSARLQMWENQTFGGQSHTRVRLQNFRQVGQCDKTALCQGSNRKQLQHRMYCYATARTLPSQALATRSDPSASGSSACTPSKGMRQHRVETSIRQEGPATCLETAHIHLVPILPWHQSTWRA